MKRHKRPFILQAQQLACAQGQRCLFSELSFQITNGSFLQIEGENGSGKTTLLRMLVGLSPVEHGWIRWQGKTIAAARDDYHASLRYIGHLPAIKGNLTGIENLQFYQPDDQEAIWSALETVGLLGYEDRPVNQLSAGQQRRVGLARLWLSHQPLWILDEPFTALDQNYIQRLIRLFDQHIEQGGAIIFTSHQALVGQRSLLNKINLVSKRGDQC